MSPTSQRLMWALRLLALIVIALNLAAPLLNEKMAWGLWPMTFLPSTARWMLGLVAVVLVLFGDRLRCPSGPWHTGQGPGGLDRVRFNSPWTRLVLALLCAVPFYLLHIRHQRWGDAKVLIQAIPHPEFKLTYVWQAPLDVFIHAKAWAVGNRLFGWPDPRPVYWIMSTAAGVIFIWVLLGLAGWLGRNRTERALLFGLVATLGTMELFFGYIENYTFMTLGVLIYIWLALRAIRHETALVWAAVALAITNAFHPSTIILTPSLLYLGVVIGRTQPRTTWKRGDAETPGAGDLEKALSPPVSLRVSVSLRRSSWARSVTSIAVPYALTFAGVIALMSLGGHGIDALLGVDFPGGGDRRWFVPLFSTTTKFEHYTMFSLGHFRDMINEQLLVAPVILPALLLVAVLAWHRLPQRDPSMRLLFLMAACYLLLIFVWNPDYGGQRDWDLFSPAMIPAAVLLGYSLPRSLPEPRALAAAGWALVAAQGFHTMAWIYQNALPQ